MTNWQKLRLYLLRWHRRLGAAIGLFVVWLALSGIALNHTDDWHLADIPIKSQAVLAHYGVSQPETISFPLGDDWLTMLGRDSLFLGEVKVSYCDGELKGAVKHATVLLALCQRELLVISVEGQLLERIKSIDGLPKGLDRIGKSGAQVVLQSLDARYAFDWRALSFSDNAKLGRVQWSSSQALPGDLRDKLFQQFAGHEISVERVVLDLHSGRYFGDWGVMFIDAVAIILCLLVTSGLWVWLGAKYRRRQR